MDYTNDDLKLLATCIWREARGQGIIGMQAVGAVIKNRIGAPGFPGTLHDVILSKNAFSSMSRPSDPQFNLAPSGPSWSQAQDVALTVLGYNVDPTQGAHYYANLHEMDRDGWFFRNICEQPEIHPHTVTIGAHDFYA